MKINCEMEKFLQSYVLNCEAWPHCSKVGIEAVFLLAREVSSAVSLTAFGGKTHDSLLFS